MPENTLLGRCSAALSEAYELAGPFDDWTEMCAGAVLEHLAAELVALHHQEPRIGVHELAHILATEGRSCQPEPVEAYNDHPSLTAAERNPSLK
jgi:hypothetical protein